MVSKRDRVFVDANVLFSASYRPDHELLFFWASSGTEMITSHYAADEARRNIGNPAHLERLKQLLIRTEVVDADEQRGHRDIALPGKDMPILWGALSARSRFLVTGDRRHFGAYFDLLFELPYGILTIIEPAALLRLLKKQE
jgi:predicted nucleic acid-binding protein